MSDPAPSRTRDVLVREEPIELCQFLKFGGLAATGGEAKTAISAGGVLLNGTVETQKRKKLRAGDRVSLGAAVIVVRVA